MIKLNLSAIFAYKSLQSDLDVRNDLARRVERGSLPLMTLPSR